MIFYCSNIIIIEDSTYNTCTNNTTCLQTNKLYQTKVKSCVKSVKSEIKTTKQRCVVLIAYPCSSIHT